jgi:hypothetical protein
MSTAPGTARLPDVPGSAGLMWWLVSQDVPDSTFSPLLIHRIERFDEQFAEIPQREP